MNKQLVATFLSLFLLGSLPVVIGQTTVTLPTICTNCNAPDTTSVLDSDWHKAGTNTPGELHDSVYHIGNVGIGVVNPEHKVHILGDLDDDPFKVQTLQPDSTLTRVMIVNSSGIVRYHDVAPNGAQSYLNNHSFYGTTSALPPNNINNDIYTMGNVGVGTASPSATLSVNGSANKPGGGTWAVFSDRRLKENVIQYSRGLDLIESVNVVSFQYNDLAMQLWGESEEIRSKQYVGVIAQELQEIAPEMVTSKNVGENSPIGEVLEVDPNAFTYALINAVKELNERVKSLEAELKQVKGNHSTAYSAQNK